MTNSKVNPSDITMHSVGTIAEPGELSFTVIVKQGQECACDVLIVTKSNIEIDKRSTNFSKFIMFNVNNDYFSIRIHLTFKTVMYPLTTPPY